MTSLQTLESLLDGAKQLIKPARDLHDFASFIKLNRLDLEKTTEAVDEIKQELHTISMNFKRDVTITKLLRDLKKFGELKIVQFVDQRALIDMSVIHTGTYSKLTKHNTKHVGETETCYITACCVLADNRCLISDFRNKSLKLFTPDWQLQSYIKLKDEALDICLIDKSQVIVTLPQVKTLQYVDIGEDIKLGSQITVDGTCWGVSHYDDKLFVYCNVGGEREIQVRSTSGKLLRQIKQSINTLNLCGPNTTDTLGHIYLSDHDNNVTCITNDGQHLYTYNHPDLKAPRRMIVDSNQNLLVCGEESNTVLHFRPDDKSGRVILQKKDGLKEPFALAYRNNSLLVGMNGCDEIYEYKYM